MGSGRQRRMIAPQNYGISTTCLPLLNSPIFENNGGSLSSSEMARTKRTKVLISGSGMSPTICSAGLGESLFADRTQLLHRFVEGQNALNAWFGSSELMSRL